MMMKAYKMQRELRQGTLQLSCLETAALIPRMVILTLDIKRLFLVTLLMSLAEILAITLRAKLLLILRLTKNLQNLARTLDLMLGSPPASKLSTR